MTLLLSALATHPDATSDVLALVMRHATATYDVLTCAEVAAHPATPDDALPEISYSLGAPDRVSLRHTLASPLLTPTTRARVLARAGLEDLVVLALHDPQAPTDVHPQLLAQLQAADPTVVDTYTIDVGYKALLTNPQTPPATHLAAITALLAISRPSTLRELLLSEATRHPADLHTLADTIAGLAATKNPADANKHLGDLAATLRAYGHQHDQGTDPRPARMAVIAKEARELGTIEGWVTAIDRSADPGIAAEGLAATHDAQHVIHAIRLAPQLRPTWLGHYAAMPPESRPNLTTLDPHRTYTMKDLLDQISTTDPPVAALGAATELPIDPTPDQVTTALAAATHRQAATSSARGIYAARLVAHPAIPADQRATLQWNLDGRDRPLAQLAAAADMTTALLNLTCAYVNTRINYPHDTWVRPILAHHLRPALTPHLTNLPLLDTLATLAPTFPGTLGELLATATTITS